MFTLIYIKMPRTEFMKYIDWLQESSDLEHGAYDPFSSLIFMVEIQLIVEDNTQLKDSDILPPRMSKVTLPPATISSQTQIWILIQTQSTCLEKWWKYPMYWLTFNRQEEWLSNKILLSMEGHDLFNHFSSKPHSCQQSCSDTTVKSPVKWMQFFPHICSANDYGISTNTGFQTAVIHCRENLI